MTPMSDDVYESGRGTAVFIHSVESHSVASGTEASGGAVVVLVGVPGAGKTTVGTALAQALGVGFRDTDDDVEASSGRAIADIFLASGEAEFRRLEAAAVEAALADHTGVLALGGGAVLDPATRARLAGLAGGRVVWLRVGLAAASKRAGLSTARPLLFGNLRAQLKALMDAREPLYREVASLVIDADERTPDEVVAAILDGLGLSARAGAGTASSAEADDADMAAGSEAAGAGTASSAEVAPRAEAAAARGADREDVDD